MSKIYRILFGLHIFVGVGALAGGLVAIINPQKPLGMSTEYLKNSPFNSYFIPGIILFVIIGLGNSISAFVMRFRNKYQGYISSIFSWALVIWIVVQCIMLRTIGFLHVLYFFIGIVEAALSMIILFRQQLFPSNIVLKIVRRVIK